MRGARVPGEASRVPPFQGGLLHNNHFRVVGRPVSQQRPPWREGKKAAGKHLLGPDWLPGQAGGGAPRCWLHHAELRGSLLGSPNSPVAPHTHRTVGTLESLDGLLSLHLPRLDKLTTVKVGDSSSCFSGTWPYFLSLQLFTLEKQTLLFHLFMHSLVNSYMCPD